MRAAFAILSAIVASATAVAATSMPHIIESGDAIYARQDGGAEDDITTTSTSYVYVTVTRTRSGDHASTALVTPAVDDSSYTDSSSYPSGTATWTTIATGGPNGTATYSGSGTGVPTSAEGAAGINKASMFGVLGVAGLLALLM